MIRPAPLLAWPSRINGMSNDNTNTTTTQMPTGWALRCCLLAARADHWLESREVGAAVSYHHGAALPWYWLSLQSDAGGWELQVGRWSFIVDRPKRAQAAGGH